MSVKQPPQPLCNRLKNKEKIYDDILQNVPTNNDKLYIKLKEVSLNILLKKTQIKEEIMIYFKLLHM